MKINTEINYRCCCGEEMKIVSVTSDGYDIYKCNLCEREE